jgi:hypothetical protein
MLTVSKLRAAKDAVVEFMLSWSLIDYIIVALILMVLLERPQ